MKYSNCLFAAWYVRLKNKNSKIIKKYRQGTRIPHWMVVLYDKNEVVHYRVVKNIFPGIFKYVLFQGEFQTIQYNDLKEFERN